MSAICPYVADALPGAGLAPATDDPARGTYLHWLFFSYGCLEPAVIHRMLSRPPGPATDISGLRSALHRPTTA